jgi:hypothetical protein
LAIPILLTAAALLLVGCGGFMDVTIEFSANEQWQADVVYTLPAEVATLAGPEELETALEEAAQGFEGEGVRTTWNSSESDGNVIYNIKITGTGLDRLAETVFDGDARIYAAETGGRRVIHFEHRGPMAMGAVWELTLKGGEILSGNGRQIDKQTMSWRNHYGPVEATLTEPSSFDAGSLLGIAAGALALGAVVYGATRLGRRRQTLPSEICSGCGFLIPEGARFCPGCGRERR